MSRGEFSPRAWLRRWRSRSPAAGLALYAFGKHPAFDDFIDVGRLPPVPDSFRHFHDALRATVERDGGPMTPMTIAWAEGGRSAVLRAQPSRDRGDAATGRFRQCPLLLGLAAPAPLEALQSFAAERLAGLAERVVTADADGVFAAIGDAARIWPTAFATDRLSPDASTDRVIIARGQSSAMTQFMKMTNVTPPMLGEWMSRSAATERELATDEL